MRNVRIKRLRPSFKKPNNSSPSQKKSTFQDRKLLCENCGKLVSYKNSKNHIARCTSNGLRVYHCSHDDCKASFVTKIARSAHVTRTHRPYVNCPYVSCGKLIKPSHLSWHKKTVHEKLKKICENCGKEVLISSFGYHRTKCVTSGEKNYRCLVEGCSSAFCSERDRYYHIQKIHSAPVKCPREGCNEFFKPSLMSYHVRLVHGTYKKPCSNCGKKMAPSNLKNHLVRCLGKVQEKTFRCGHEGCEASFATKDYLDHHVRCVHAEPIPCPFNDCEKLVKVYSMVRHIRTMHLTSNRKKCRHCETMMRPNNLKKHEIKCEKELEKSRIKREIKCESN